MAAAPAQGDPEVIASAITDNVIPQGTSGSAGRGAVLTFAYSVGLGIPFLMAAFSVSAVMRRFGWARRHARSLMMVGGIMLVLLGVLQVTGVWFELMTRLQVLVLNWQSPL